MKHDKRLIIKKKGSIVYSVKAGDSIIWEGKDIHKSFPALKSANRGKELIISWKADEDYLGV